MGVFRALGDEYEEVVFFHDPPTGLRAIVAIGDPKRDKTEELLRAYGRFIDSLGGRYITAEDVGTAREDMDILRRETGWVTGVSKRLGGSGDPSPVTAWGTLQGLRACIEEELQTQSFDGLRVVVQGVG